MSVPGVATNLARYLKVEVFKLVGDLGASTRELVVQTDGKLRPRFGVIYFSHNCVLIRFGMCVGKLTSGLAPVQGSPT
jgi:hypothetical protein